MDNYSYDEIVNLVNSNLLSGEILENVLKSTTRRVELYNDSDDLKILKYLSYSKNIPKNTRNEINNYLKEYKKITKKRKIIDNKNKKRRRYTFIIIIILLIISLCVFLIVERG